MDQSSDNVSLLQRLSIRFETKKKTETFSRQHSNRSIFTFILSWASNPHRQTPPSLLPNIASLPTEIICPMGTERRGLRLPRQHDCLVKRGEGAVWAGGVTKVSVMWASVTADRERCLFVCVRTCVHVCWKWNSFSKVTENTEWSLQN